MSDPTTPHDTRTPEQIETDIAQQRAELGETVDALAAKLDVKSQAKARIAQAKDSATTDTGMPRPELLAIAAAAVAGVVLLVWRRRRRHSAY